MVTDEQYRDHVMTRFSPERRLKVIKHQPLWNVILCLLPLATSFPDRVVGKRRLKQNPSGKTITVSVTEKELYGDFNVVGLTVRAVHDKLLEMGHLVHEHLVLIKLSTLVQAKWAKNARGNMPREYYKDYIHCGNKWRPMLYYREASWWVDRECTEESLVGVPLW